MSSPAACARLAPRVVGTPGGAMLQTGRRQWSVFAVVSCATAVLVSSCASDGDADADPTPVGERLRAAATTFVSIGDSYASGEGSPVPYDMRNWPALNVQLLNASSSLTDVSTETRDFIESFGGFPSTYSGLDPGGQFIGPVVEGEVGGLATSFPCHRSPYNGRAFAYSAITRSIEGYLGRFIDLACSGAQIRRGLLGPQVTEQDFQPARSVPAQLELADRLNVTNWVLLISVGVNDIGFVEVVNRCLSPGDCANRNVLESVDSGVWVDPVNPLDAQSLLWQGGAFVPGLSGLNAEFDDLAEAIAEGTGVDDEWEPPKAVIITQYPPPVGNASVGYCDSFDDDARIFSPDKPVRVTRTTGGLTAPEISLGGVLGEDWSLDRDFFVGGTLNLDRNEAEVLTAEVLQPLNQVIESAANEHGWDVVVADSSEWAEHSLCREFSYINGVRAAVTLQGNVSGTAHPNCAGHLATARSLFGPMLEAAGFAATDFGEPYPELTTTPNPDLPCRFTGSTPAAMPVEFPAWGPASFDPAD